MTISSELEIEIAKGGGKGKRKEKATEAKSMEVDVEMGMLKFVVPTLLPGVHNSHFCSQNIPGQQIPRKSFLSH